MANKTIGGCVQTPYLDAFCRCNHRIKNPLCVENHVSIPLTATWITGYARWQQLPPVPVKYSEALDFGYTVLNSSHLYLFGGEDPLKESLRWISFYSARMNKGFKGECTRRQRTLHSAEIYDPNRNGWSKNWEIL